MKRLLLDVGNSRVKWALAESRTLAPAQALPHHGAPSAVLAGIVAAAIDEIWIANVTGAAHAAALAAAAQARFGIVPRFAATAPECLGLHAAYADVSRLGVDRWLALLAAWQRARGPICVASCGTALTFDAVDTSGRHLGGVIAPGLVTAQQAVLGATRFAAGGPDRNYNDGLGTDTEACVRQGALHACAGLIERLAAQQPGAACFITGGDAAVLRAHVEGRWTEAPDLVLEGLLALAEAGL